MSENIAAALERSDRLFGDREAVVDGGLRWSYRELRRRVAASLRAWAGVLRTRPLWTPESRLSRQRVARSIF